MATGLGFAGKYKWSPIAPPRPAARRWVRTLRRGRKPGPAGRRHRLALGLWERPWGCRCCAWGVRSREEAREKPRQLGRARWPRPRFNSPGRPVRLAAAPGGRGKQGSAGRQRPGAGADAGRTMGLFKGMLEEVWRALCIASSALQVGIGQLGFNEVHSRVCSSARALGARGLG